MGLFLFSIDLEDVSGELEGSGGYTERVVPMTQRYLTFLQKYNARATFFTVGDTARAFPGLIKEIADEGHEIACHSDTHTPLSLQTPDSFKADLMRNLDALDRAGVKRAFGFRAPIFSLTEKTQWAYSVLNELEFKYSSSILPAKSPLYGWKEFGTRPRMIGGVLELPVSIFPFRHIQSPMAGGTYFRLFPLSLIYRSFQKRAEAGDPIVGYFHPQDCDAETARLKYKAYNPIFNWLLNYNKASVFRKLEYVMEQGYEIITCYEYSKQISL